VLLLIPLVLGCSSKLSGPAASRERDASRPFAARDAAMGDRAERDASAGSVARDAAAAGSGGRPATARDSGTDAATLSKPDAAVINGPPPKVGEPGCGLAAAAFCDSFDGPSANHGRAGELDTTFWAAGRMMGQLSTTRAMGIGMAVIPDCRSGVSNHVWPDADTLICDPTADVASNHLLVAVAAQNYGQNGYRIRQPFDFAGRTGKVVFDATVDPLSPLHGWVSFAVTEDPMSIPGYSILGNDEGSVIPRNAIEVHFVNAPGSTGDAMSMRNVHVFRNYADTVYAPAELPRTPYRAGKMNHFEFLVSEHSVDVRVTPYSDDGVTFAAPAIDYHVDAEIPFSRGYVHVSVHNHATIKYTQPDTFPNVVDASVALIDNVGFDGPVITSYREYEVPDALVRFTDDELKSDPYNAEHVGYDIAYVLQDAAMGPKQVLHFAGVDLQGVASARLAFSVWLEFHSGAIDTYAVRVRFNGKGWLERKLSAEEVAMLSDGPTTIDPGGAPVGDPASQGRLALMLEVPLEDLVAGDNTVELVTANIPTSYPPLALNLDLVLKTNE
jgi:hypothetical protein